MFKDYQGWLLDNKDFYNQLKNHDSSLYYRFQPVYEVLYYLYENNKDSSKIDEDIDKIFQVGLEYLHMQFFTCKLLLEKTFKNDFHAFLVYDQVIGYNLFLEDLKYELIEKSIKYNQDELDKLSNYLDDLIENKTVIPDNLNLYVDSKVYKIIGKDTYHFTGIIDIFVEIADTLGLNFEEENDILLGDEI
jgi:hypothetical protein